MTITYQDHFELAVVPKAWARTGGRGARRFETKEQRQAKQTLAALLLEHRPPRILTGPIILGVRVFYPIPAGWPRWKHNAVNMGLWPRTSKPDLDNHIKLLKDVMKGTFYLDDRQVFRLEPAEKGYSDRPRWEVSITEVALPTRAEIEAMTQVFREEKEDETVDV